MTATVKHLKQFEKIFLSIRENAEEKLAALNSEFLEHQEWLKKAVVDTKESKDGLGLVCPATVRKAKPSGSRVLQKDDEDKENADNGSKPSRSKLSTKSMAPKSLNGDDNFDVFDPENDEQLQQSSKSAKNAVKGKTSRDGEKITESKAVAIAEREKELSKMKVVQLKDELQKRGLPAVGKKDELVSRLASAMELDETQTKVKKTVEMVVGKDVSPFVGMRVRHISGKDHRSSRGQLGTIEIIPGRGALKADERSVSVRWDADKSDVRGPYYTGEPCDRGSGIGTEKFDLTTLQEVMEDEHSHCGAAAEKQQEATASTPAPTAAPAAIEGLQEDEDAMHDGEDADAPATHQHEAAAASTCDAPADEQLVEQVVEATEEEMPSDSPRPTSVSAAAAATEKLRLSGSKRNSDGDVKDQDTAERADTDKEARGGACLPLASPAAAPASVQVLQQRLNQCKQAWTQRMSIDASPKALSTPLAADKSKTAEARGGDADEQSRPVRSTRKSQSSAKKAASTTLSTPTREASTVAAASSSKKARGAPTAMEASGNTLCMSAKKAAQPMGPCSQPHESVQHFRAIISRIHAEKAATATDLQGCSSSSSALPPRSSTTSRLPGAYVSSAAAAAGKEEAAAAHASKPGTWPMPALKPTGIKLTEPVEPCVSASAGSSSSGRLTAERLSAHIQSEGKQSMLQTFANSRGVAAEASSESLAASSSTAAARDAARATVMDAAAKQQRAAENRARIEEEMRKKAAEQDKRRKELELKRQEADRISKERRDREAKEQQDKLDAAKQRAQEDDERRMKQLQEEAERKRQERERAEQQERERLERERLERERAEQERAAKEAKASEAAAAAAAAAAAKKVLAVPSFTSSSMAAKTPSGTGFFGAIGSVFKGVLGTPGTGDAAPPATSTATTEPSAAAALASLKQKEPCDQGPTSIKIIESKNSDDSDSDDEDKKQPVPVWAQSPNLRRQLHRQIDVSPTPVFGECKKTCDLAAMFVNHQPKRRRYDKRTSSANWGDDGGASFMAEQRFEQQVKLNIAMQNEGS